MKFINTYNSVVSSIVLVLSTLLGQLWYLFALFLMFNILDWLTGWYKARVLKTESSKVGAKGIIKKIGYWVIIVVAFSVPLSLQPIGIIIGIDLSFLQLIGWFTLASLMVNELRSIFENLLESGYKVPMVLIKGLAITDELVNKEENK